MTHAFETYSGGLSGLPDPDRDRQFYEGVPGRRLAAWFVDLGVALLIGLPLAGWVILSAAGKPIPFFGLELPALVAPDTDLAKFVKGWHEWFGALGYWLIGLHALAGLYHHYVVRDNTLLRMLPQKGD